MADTNLTPDWSQSHTWDEFEWEQALKYSDHVAARYFRMLDRFGDLPDGEDFIVAKIGDQNFFEVDDDTDFDDDWESDEDGDGFSGEGDDDVDSIAPGDSLFYETYSVYKKTRQVSLGWCNILATVLQPDDRIWGAKILFYFGRMLSALSVSIGDGTFERPAGSVAFAKRASSHLNHVLGEINAKEQLSPAYEPMFKMVREHLLELHDEIIDYLTDLRRREDQSEDDDA